MSALPKLPEAVREEIRQVIERRRNLQRMIATLEDEKRQLPNRKELAQRYDVSYDVVARVAFGDPYKTAHPQDLATNARRMAPPCVTCNIQIFGKDGLMENEANETESV
jgi:hypothetical protein